MVSLIGMATLTTIKVSIETARLLRDVAEAEGTTLDKALRLVLRRERQRQLGDAASRPVSDEDAVWLDGGRREVGRVLVDRSAD